jgi:hypothetical protein
MPSCRRPDHRRLPRVRPGGRQKPGSSRAPARARSRNVKVTRAQGPVAVRPDRMQSCRTAGSIRPGREQRCTRSVRSLPRPPMDIFREFAIAPPRTHGCGPHVLMLSGSQAPFPAARTDADRAAARLLSPGTDPDRRGARLISSGTEPARGRTRLIFTFLHRAARSLQLHSGSSSGSDSQSDAGTTRVP